MDNASFLSLTPSDPIETARVMFEPQPVPKSPLLAFLVSLAFPGAGQIYCGKTSRGLRTLAIFLPALALTTPRYSSAVGRDRERFLLGHTASNHFISLHVCVFGCFLHGSRDGCRH